MIRVVFVLALIVALTGSAWAEDARVKLAMTQYRVKVQIIERAHKAALAAAQESVVKQLWAAIVVRDTAIAKIRQAAAKAAAKAKRPPAKPAWVAKAKAAKAKRAKAEASAKVGPKPKKK